MTFHRLLHALRRLLPVLLAAGLCACRGEARKEEGSAFLLAFYRAYATEFLHGTDQRADSLLRRHCTEAFYEKLQRMIEDTDGNPLLRAQDYTDHALQTLQTRPLGDEWYEASWQWQPGSARGERIPLRLEHKGGEWHVAYVTPYAYGAACSDTLFFQPGESPYSVQPGAAPTDFLRSFVQSYAAIYATLQPHTAKRTATLRKAWLTDEAQADFRQAAQAQADEGWPDYDLLIAGFDCDRPDIGQIRIDSVSNLLFTVQFPRRSEHLHVQLTPVSGSYRISSLKASNDTMSLDEHRGLLFLTRFYHAYLQNECAYDLNDKWNKQYFRTRDSLQQHCLTEFMQDRVQRIWNEGRGDYVPITIAQEYNAEMPGTLDVKSMGNRWFRVRYWWNKEEAKTNTPIEVAFHLNGKQGDSLRIDYFTPPYCKPCYGDSVIYEQPIPIEVEQTSSEAFLRSFYRAYTQSYCCLGLRDAEAYRDSLRQQHLTPRALRQWKSAINNEETDTFEGYDALIDGYYFERLWQKRMQFLPQGNLVYFLPHQPEQGGSSNWGIRLSLIRTRTAYFIDDIAVAPLPQTSAKRAISGATSRE